MQITAYDPWRHALAVRELWDESLGETWPLSERSFLAGTIARPSYEPGDALVAMDGDRVVGFGMVEIDWPTPRPKGSIAALVIHPEYQRQGRGTALLDGLEARLREAGCGTARLGAALNRLWPALPRNLPDAEAFFASRGYEPAEGDIVDMVIDLADLTLNDRWQACLRDQRIRCESATRKTLPAILEYHSREFPGWTASLLRMAGAGDLGNALCLWHEDEVVGSIQTFTPDSRWCNANLMWEACFEAALGGFGAVGIAETWRGRGLGVAMCAYAAAHVQEHGARHCYIDWTGLIDFYAKVGAQVWRRFRHHTKAL